VTAPLPTLPAAMHGYLALRDYDHVLFSLAVTVAAEFDGDPLWGSLVGAPSSGKTEMLRALDDVADEHLGVRPEHVGSADRGSVAEG
jgi:hypothetical protein